MSERSPAIGDVFSVPIDASTKKYFQLLGRDSLQLNSDVIRAFATGYSLTASPSCSEIVKDSVAFTTHCFVRLGLRANTWTFACNSPFVGRIATLFRDSEDYGAQVATSERWYTWRVGDARLTSVGRLQGEAREAEIGVVVPPNTVVHRMRTGEHDFRYPGFD